MAIFGLPSGGEEWLIIAISLALSSVLYVYPLWRICERLGRPGYMALLFFVPFGVIVLLWILALREPPNTAVARAQFGPPPESPGVDVR